MPDREQEYWNENFDGLTKRWVTSVVTGGPPKGMVSARACHAFAGEKTLGATHPDGATNSVATNGPANGINRDLDPSPDVSDRASIFPGLDYIRQAQLLFWLDLSKMEHMGRWDKTHVKLRRDFFGAYGRGGIMEGGDLLLWVDMGILKREEMDAEYIGCYDATGFMAYDSHPLFASEQIEGAAKLPGFFDQPIESKPIEW